MSNNINTKKCSEQEWKTAQATEFQCWGGYNVGDGDDYSEYWKENTQNYDLLKGRHFSNIIEVGCGPFGKNLVRVLELVTYDKLYVLDPLLGEYCANGRSGIHKLCQTYGITQFVKPLEEFTDCPNTMDLVICNNVLDHCFDSDRCFQNVYDSLKVGGYLLFGNDLKDEADLVYARDAMHPIMLQEDYLRKVFSKYTSLYEKIIPRHECRNPGACCGCIFTILKKES